MIIRLPHLVSILLQFFLPHNVRSNDSHIFRFYSLICTPPVPPKCPVLRFRCMLRLCSSQWLTLTHTLQLRQMHLHLHSLLQLCDLIPLPYEFLLNVHMRTDLPSYSLRIMYTSLQIVFETFVRVSFVFLIDTLNINEYHERVNRVCDSLKSGTGSVALST